MRFNLKSFVLWMLVAAFAGLLFNEVFAQALRTEKADILTTNDPARTYVEIDSSKDLQMEGVLRLGPDQIDVYSETLENTSTGLNSDSGTGFCSINGGNAALFDITAGEGHIVNGSYFDVQWGAFTAQTVTNLATSGLTYVYIDSAGAIVQTTTVPSPTERRQMVYLCRLVHINNTIINNVVNNPEVTEHPANQLGDLMDAIGVFNATGNIYSENGANLSLNKSAGVLFNKGANYHNSQTNPHELTIAAGTALAFRRATITGSNPTTTVTTIDPANYDVGGTITAIPGGPNVATVQYIYLFPSGDTYVQYGQTVYTTLAAAKAGAATANPIPLPGIAGGVLRSALAVTRTCTDLRPVTGCAQFLAVGKFGDLVAIGGSSTLQSAYSNSVAGTIVLDSTRGAVKIADAATPTGGNLFSVVNNAISAWYFRVTASLAEFFDNLQITANEIATVTGDINFAPGTGILTKTDANANTVTLGSNNPELANKMEYPSFEEGISSQVTCTGCTGGALTRVPSNTHGSWAAQAAYAGLTGTVDIVVPAAELLNMPVDVSCYVTTPATASNVWFVSQRNGVDTGWEVQIPAGTTTKLAGIYLGAGGGSTSTGMQIDIRTAITGNIVLDDCSVGTELRSVNFSQVTGADVLLRAQGNAGQSITAGTTDIPFAETYDPYGLWDGDSFEVPSSDVYTVCARVFYTDSNNRILGLYQNGSAYRNLSDLQSSTFEALPLQCYTDQFTAGAALSIRELSVSGTLSNNLVNHWITITRVKSANTITLGPDNFTGQTKWKSYTGSSFGGLGTPAVQNLKWKRDGNEMLIKGYLEVGTTTGALGFIPLPSGYQIDTAELTRNVNTTNLSEVVGGWYRGIINTGPFHGLILPATLTSTTVLYLSDHWNTSSNRLVPSSLINSSIASGDAIAINIRVPILGWDQGSAIAEVIRPKVCVLTDQKSAGTNGGSATAGSWNPRALNTIVGECDFASLSNGTTGTDGTANVFSINTPGVYQISCSAPSYYSAGSQVRIMQDPLGSPTTVANGSSSYSANTTGASSTVDEIEVQPLTVSSATSYQLQHFLNSVSGAGTASLGVDSGSGVSRYFSRCTITKLQ